MRKTFLFFLLFLAIFTVANGQIKVEKPSLYVDDVGSPGAQKAIKKAHQMTDLEFVPLNTIVANQNKTYQSGEKSKGLIYSSVKETNAFVGLDVSFHTFMTAMHNPRSVLYTENVSEPPYHGKNAAAYYGTVCSGLVSYALGLDVYLKSYDIPQADCMMMIENQSSEGIRLADVMWKKGHVALITGIRRNKTTGEVIRVEYCEAAHKGCRRVVKDGRKDFDQLLIDGQWKIYRYKNLEKNDYTPLTEFVAVEGEHKTPFKYNDVLCPNRGDKSCYNTGDSVVLNILNERFNRIIIYKDSQVYKRLRIKDNLDIVLKDLPYGDYKARLVRWFDRSDFAYWIVVDVNVDVDPKKGIVSFNSMNSTPVGLEFCSISGGRPIWGYYSITTKDVLNGYVDVSQLPVQTKIDKGKTSYYARIIFQSDYGRVINHPILWK